MRDSRALDLGGRNGARPAGLLWLCLAAVSIICCAAAAGAQAGSSSSDCRGRPPRGFGEEGWTTYRGVYVDRDSCFSVRIPGGLTGYGSGPTDHGFGLVVQPRPIGYLHVGADPNAWEAESAEQEARSFIDGWTAEKSEALLSAETTRTTLGGLPAARAVVRYRCPDSAVYVAEYVVALSPDQETIFEVSLYSPESAYAEHRLVFDGLVETWRFEPFPDNPRCAPKSPSH